MGALMANKFTLKGRDLEITCTINADSSLLALNYHQGSFAKSFTPDQVHIDDTMLGRLITITLELSVDTGATTFSLMLPTLDVPLSDSVDFTTLGIYKEARGPVILPKRQVTDWRSVPLYGIAQTVLMQSEHVRAN
jgi:hypothetical protein